MKLDEAWSLFRESEFPRVVDKTQSAYTTAWQRHIRRLPDPPTRRDVTHWHREFVADGYSKSYANFCLYVLQAIARRTSEQTGDRGLLIAASRVRPFRVVLESRCPPRDLMERVLPVARNQAERCFLLLAGYAGLRRMELLGLRPDDWDAELGVLSVTRQRHREHRKNIRPHAVRIEDPELAALIVWVAGHPDEVRAKNGHHTGASDGYLFPWSKNYLYYFMRRLRAHLGDDAPRYFPPGSAWHAFRHWGATRLAREGATLAELMGWLGDSTPEVAARYCDQVRGQSTAIVAVNHKPKPEHAPRRPLRATLRQGARELRKLIKEAL